MIYLRIAYPSRFMKSFLLSFSNSFPLFIFKFYIPYFLPPFPLIPFLFLYSSFSFLSILSLLLIHSLNTYTHT